MKLLIALILFSTFLYASFAQNLLPNPSFEDRRGNRQSMHPWQMINTIDYFIYDESKVGQVLRTKIKDKNFKLRTARTGTAYVGLRVWPMYSEYIVIQLPEPLGKDAKYLFEMYVVLSPHSNSYLKSIGMSAYSFKPPYAQRSANQDFPPQFVVFNKYGIGNDKDWTKVAGVFTAQGGERFVTIGNFSLKNKNKFKRRKPSFKKREAYYYIDDVALYKLDQFGYPIYGDTVAEEIVMNNPNASTLDMSNEKPDIYYRTITFPPLSSELNYEAYLKLAYIIDYMNTNPEIHIKITGFTAQNEIPETYTQDEINQLNALLSTQRVKTIYNFLTGNRINRNRIYLYYSKNICQLHINEDVYYDCKRAYIEFLKEPVQQTDENNKLIQILP